MHLTRYTNRIRREIITRHHQVRSRQLRLEDGDYLTSYNVPHYTERCGWREFGAKDSEEYEYWWQRACGMVSLHIILDAIKLARTSQKDFDIMSEIRHGIETDAYLMHDKHGRKVDIGWTHAGLVKLARERGIRGTTMHATLPMLCRAILDDKLIIASVAAPIVRFTQEGKPPTKSGGHLIVIKGFAWQNEHCAGLYYEDPYDIEAQANFINSYLFKNIFNGSSIILYE